MIKLHELAEQGQSIWYDNIRRALIEQGELAELLTLGVTGVTSNPTIFEKAIAGSMDYDTAIATLTAQGKTVEEIYEALTLDDIQRTADLLRPIYDRTDGADGYVSLEVRPTLAHDTQGTVAEARILWANLGRPNVMIKVPATSAGIPAIITLVGEGINVNVTLIFALATYEAVANAYIAGLEQLAVHGGDVRRVASVASFFISRIDTAVDAELARRGNTALPGKIAIANAKLAYAHFRKLFSGARWEKLAQNGARVQRPLWASTGAKNPSYPATLYIDQLIGADTVNTVPPAALTAFIEHGTVAATLTGGLDEARAQLTELKQLGIDLDAITQQLQDEGVASFAKSFQALLESVAMKRQQLQMKWQPMEMRLGEYQGAVDAALDEVRTQEIVKRIWQHDWSVWREEPTEITNRLGWLHMPDVMMGQVERMTALRHAVKAEGYTHALLFGMGGSSLAPEVFAKTFGRPAGTDGASARSDHPYLELAILDTTDADAVRGLRQRLDLGKTLFIVATKSGGTVETFSAFRYFYNEVAAALGEEKAGAHFIAITDPGSKLAEVAKAQHFRATFLNDPNIGGRYAALSFFGLLPAALVGVDVALLLERAMQNACNAASCNCAVAGDNLAARLGVTLGELARQGRDKLTIIASPAIASFADWVEQLIAESTGKDGKGILPVVGEPLGAPAVYNNDRLFVHLRLDGEHADDEPVAALAAAGHPLITFNLKDNYDLGGQFFLWEMATAIAGYRLGIHPFDQPNVEAAKVLARQLVAEFTKTGKLPADEPASVTPDALRQFLSQAQAGDYVAIHAYVQPTPQTNALLLRLRTGLRDRLKLATTVGYGPRFLHSTGQLHKGDGGNGLFIQFTSDTVQDVAIPDETGAPKGFPPLGAASSISFDVLKNAQALGDAQALRNVNRRLIRFHLGRDVLSRLQRLIETMNEEVST
jgi:transaldolase/glucose-6-phosphate isomerase